jgi:hypothetical protein
VCCISANPLSKISLIRGTTVSKHSELGRFTSKCKVWSARSATPPKPPTLHLRPYMITTLTCDISSLRYRFLLAKLAALIFILRLSLASRKKSCGGMS